METQKSSLNLKAFPWADWDEWLHLFHLIFPSHSLTFKNQSAICLSKLQENNPQLIDLKLGKALRILKNWIHRNIGSADHSRALKMQKLIVEEVLARNRNLCLSQKSLLNKEVDRSERRMAASFRLVQLVELGAKTA
jgi:hypothetical protein